MTLKKPEGTGNGKRKNCFSLGGELALEEAINLL